MITTTKKSNEQLPLDIGALSPYEKYTEDLKRIQQIDAVNRFDKDEVLNDNEQVLNQLMNQFRQSLREEYATRAKQHLTAKPFFEVRQEIDSNPLFTVFKNMPKGGNLHIHSSACADITAIVDLFVNDPEICDDVYIYLGEPTDKIVYGTLFYSKATFDVQELDKLSDALSNGKIDQARLIDLLTFSSSRIHDAEYIWNEFHNCLKRIATILNVRAIYDQYYESTLRSLSGANVDYVELRLLIRPDLIDDNEADIRKLFEPNYTPAQVNFDKIELVERIYSIYKRLQTEPEFENFKLKVIISGSRSASQSVDDTKKHIQLTKHWMEQWKAQDDGFDFVIGYDLVSEEDRGRTTDEYAKMILEEAVQVPFYFHDGETNWADNTNVHAAFLLGTKRIGHGINLYNFPHLLALFIEKDIALEVCPISNQLLRYVPDLRSHPMGEYLKRGVQCVVCSDDPQLFHYTGLAYDYWEVYHALLIDLKAIKKLVKNTYQYSGMTTAEKEKQLAQWQPKWDAFVVQSIDELQKIV